MWKLFFFIVFLGSAILASAQQTDRGTVITGSDFGAYDRTSAYVKLGDSAWTDSYRNTGLHITPRVGFFVAEGFAMGLSLSYSINHSEYDNNVVSRTLSYRAGPFMRFYMKAGGVAPFAEAEAGIWNRTDKISFSGTSVTIKYPGWTAGAGAGLAIFIGEKAALEGKVGYYTDQFREEGSVPAEKRKYNQFRFSMGASFFL